MSKDIRSYFNVIATSKSAKSQNAKPSVVKPAKRRAIQLESSDEDTIPETPPAKEIKKSKKPKMEIISSDSEDDSFKKKVTKIESGKNELLKPVNIAAALGTNPVKQSKVEKIEPVLEPSVSKNDTSKKKRKTSKKLNTELGIHSDKNFENSLLDLDDDFFIENMDALNKTIEMAMTNKQDTQVKECNSKKDMDVVEPKKSPHKSTSSSDGSKTPNPNRKRKQSENENESSIDPDQERHEKRRQSAVLYQKYLNRSGPAHHGSKELPKGDPNCLKNLCFLRTGVLDSLDDNDFQTLVTEHGGRVVHSVSKKVNYIVVGDEPGPAKLEKARNYGIKTISEDEFLDLILIKSKMKPIYCKDTNDGASTSNGDHENNLKKQQINQSKKTDNCKQPKVDDFNLKNKKMELDNVTPILKTVTKPTEKINKKIEDKVPLATESSKKFDKIHKFDSTKPKSLNNLSWTEKYKPTDLKHIIGQQGDRSNMHKLIFWLQNWYTNHSGKNKPKVTRPSPWAKSDDGAYFKCALLSGPPGVGKTTTATLVAKTLDFDVVEFNASDTRSKKLLHEEVSQLLSTKSLAGYFNDGSAPSKKHVLLMDEVDGMAGNEDRGGVQELILLIKNSNVPIICMCNDRNHPKIRSLSNYCFDLRFSKPRLEQIKGAMMKVCFREGIDIKPDALAEIITGADMDVRQTLNHLSLWSVSKDKLDVTTMHKEADNAKRDKPLGAWEVCRKVFSEEDHKTMSLVDKSRLFFHDYSIGPLFVQENYLQVIPHAPKKEWLERAANTAESLCMADIVDTKIRRGNNWTLLDLESMYASVLPGYYMEGHVGGQINFPSWLGKNSKKNKFQRILSELQSHMRMSISGSRQSVNLDYMKHLRDKIIRPLIKEGSAGVPESIQVLQDYNLLKDDFDNLIELAQWPKQKNPMDMIASSVKSALTRTYNKSAALLPYSVSSVVVKKKSAVNPEDDLYGDEEATESDNNDDIENDAMIKAKKPRKESKASTSKKEPKASTSKKEPKTNLKKEPKPRGSGQSKGRKKK